MKRKLALFILLAAATVPIAVLAQTAQFSVSFGIPGTNSNASGTSPGAWVANFYQFALLIAGVLALGAIVYGGVKYTIATGNPSGQSEAKEWIYGALLGLLLLAGAYVILYTINPNLLNLNLPTLPTVSFPQASYSSGYGGNLLCSDLAALAASNNEPYPHQNSPAVNALISCVHSHVSFSAVTWTFDVSHDSCNYTRGFPLCESCSHAQNSCHYGGHTGTDGARAVDFDIIGQTAQNIVNAAVQNCGIPPVKARCEAGSVSVPCIGGGADHVHLSTANCDSN